MRKIVALIPYASCSGARLDREFHDMAAGRDLPRALSYRSYISPPYCFYETYCVLSITPLYAT